jgi:hypothetical protein
MHTDLAQHYDDVEGPVNVSCFSWSTFSHIPSHACFSRSLIDYFLQKRPHPPWNKNNVSSNCDWIQYQQLICEQSEPCVLVYEQMWFYNTVSRPEIIQWLGESGNKKSIHIATYASRLSGQFASRKLASTKNHQCDEHFKCSGGSTSVRCLSFRRRNGLRRKFLVIWQRNSSAFTYFHRCNAHSKPQRKWLPNWFSNSWRPSDGFSTRFHRHSPQSRSRWRLRSRSKRWYSYQHGCKTTQREIFCYRHLDHIGLFESFSHMLRIEPAGPTNHSTRTIRR